MIIFISHIIIDLWKSYQPDKAKYFVINQVLHFSIIFLHFSIIFLLWLSIFNNSTDFWIFVIQLYHGNQFLAVIAGYLIVTWPLGILIGIATERWRNEPGVNTDGLAKAGMWIGFFERFLIFTFILINQYTAIGFLIAAKSVLRFIKKTAPKRKLNMF